MTSPSSSQETLALPPPSIRLTFQRNSMLATTVVHGARPVYVVSTDKHGATTEVHIPGSGNGALAARIVRREILPDTVELASVNPGKPVRIGRWLPRMKLKNGPAANLETSIGSCVLCPDPVHRLALHSPDLTTVVAHWEAETASSPMTLVLAPGIESSQLQILVAFLYEEQRLRMAEKNRAMKAAAFRTKGHLTSATVSLRPLTGDPSSADL